MYKRIEKIEVKNTFQSTSLIFYKNKKINFSNELPIFDYLQKLEELMAKMLKKYCNRHFPYMLQDSVK